MLDEVHTLQPGVRVLVLTMHPEVIAVWVPQRRYITKDSAPEQLVTAVNKVRPEPVI